MIMEIVKDKTKNYTATRNACKLCTPLGASLVFRGLEDTIPLLHGSQGCATYIRRYMISHYKEPIDISSSNFAEETAVFGGQENLKTALANVICQYHPKIVGIASTCLSETIGDDVPAILKAFKQEWQGEPLPHLVHVSTPSYRGTHMDGYNQTISAVVQALAQKKEGATERMINIMPGMMSPEDLRYLKQVMHDFAQPMLMCPDYSETLDGPSWSAYHVIPPGGTPAEDIQQMAQASGSIEFGHSLSTCLSAGRYLQETFAVPNAQLNWPIGVQNSDQFFKTLESLTGRTIPEAYLKTRGRLLDSYADGHKHTFNVKAVLYGEEDLVVAMARFCRELGIIPICCASGGHSGLLEKQLRQVIPDFDELGINAKSNVDFIEIESLCRSLKPDIIIGNSKGYKLSKTLQIPLVRVGFPIHDRIGGQRILHIGYHGTQQLFDRIVNAIIEAKQEASSIGYTYM